MLDFVNEIITCFRLFISFLFNYSLPGINLSIGYIALACMILVVVINYILGSVR